MAIEIAHLSDSHLGYEAYDTRSSEGINQRGKDVVRAMSDCVQAIVADDPALVIHSGDVLERPSVKRKYEVQAKLFLEELAGIRPDGSRRQVVVIAGNHEQTRSRKELCWLDMLRGLPGLHLVDRSYERIRFDDADAPASLADVVVHTLPHDLLKTIDFDGVVPTEGAVNILTAHGVAGGSALWSRIQGGEQSIPIDVLTRDWDYVALGHWHKRGPVAVGGFTEANTPIWYAGSAERMGFGDVRPGSDDRGWLRVLVNPGGETPLKVFPQDIAVRPMFNMDPVDLSDVAVEDREDVLIAAVDARDTTGAVVHLPIKGISRDVYGLLDLARVRAAADDTLHFKVTLVLDDLVTDEEVGANDEGVGGAIAEVLEGVLATVDPSLVEAVRELTTSLLGDALTATTDDDTDADDTDGDTGNEQPEKKAA